MANLNSWQKLDRVLLGLPYGDGRNASYSSATAPALTKDSCNGTSGSTTFNTTSSTFSNGDILLIHQSRGTGVGQWEINKVLSGGGTNSLTLQKELQYTYIQSGNSQAQAIKINQYTDVTVQAGTWTIPAWDGTTGGILIFVARGTLTITGTTVGTGKGFLHSTNFTGIAGSPNYQGEGSVGTPSISSSANGDGGGGGLTETIEHALNAKGGGGGGNGTPGSDGLSGGGIGGSVSGAADGTILTFGGSGGRGGRSFDGGGQGGQGGDGGGIIIIFAKSIVVSGGVANNGINGANADDRAGGGGGAGGTILIGCDTITLGANLVTATAGTGGPSGTVGSAGGQGGTGRIAIHHVGQVTGTTNPTFTDVVDTSLREKAGGAFII